MPNNSLIEKVNELVAADEALKEQIQAFQIAEADDSPDIFKMLIDSCHIKRQQSDDVIRALFVGLQGHFEKAIAELLSSKEITAAVGVIHTKTPATPLCAEGKAVSDGLVAPEILADPSRLKTVTERQDIVRAFMQAGGTLIANYSTSGIEARTKEQMDIFQRAKASFADQLIDLSFDLGAEEYPADISGATYLLKLHDEDEVYCFGIMASQANAPGALREWGLWCGPQSQPQVAARLAIVDAFLKQHTSVSLVDKIEELISAVPSLSM